MSPGRTGSSLLARLIKDYYRQHGISYSIHYDHDIVFPTIDNTSNIIFHTHDKRFFSIYNLDPTLAVLVLSKRESAFDVVISTAVAHQTEEYVDYSNKKIKPFIYEIWQFHRLLLKYLKWYDDIDLVLPFKQIVSISYEETIDINQFCKKFQFCRFNTDIYSKFPKSPYLYNEIIANWQELNEYYILQIDKL